MGGWGKPPAPKGQRGLLAKKKAAAAAGGVVRRPLKAKNPPADLLWRQPSVKPDAGADESPRTQRARACKLEAARAVGWREQCLMSLNTLVLNWPPVPKKAMNRQDDHRAAEAVRWLKNQSLELRDAGLNCVEKIVAWVLAVSNVRGEPEPFLWNGSDYLLKMYSDLDFVFKQLGKKAWVNGNFSEGNPLLLSQEELAGRGERKLMSRIRAASNVLYDVVLRNNVSGRPVVLAVPTVKSGKTAGKRKATTRATTGGAASKSAAASKAQPPPLRAERKAGGGHTAQRPALPPAGRAESKAAAAARRPDAAKKASKSSGGGASKKASADASRAEAKVEATVEVPVASPKIEAHRGGGGEPAGAKEVEEDAPPPPDEVVVEEEEEEQEEVVDEEEEAGEMPTAVEEAGEEKGQDDVEEEEEEEEVLAAEESEEEDYGDEDYEDEYEEEELDEEDAEEEDAARDEAEADTWTDWEQQKLLGEGNYGDVFAVVHRRSGLRGAMKRFKGAEEDDDEETAQYVLTTQRREVDLARKLKHPNIVSLLGAFEKPSGRPNEPPEPLLVFELMPMNALDMIEKFPNGMAPAAIVELTRQLCEGLAYCHANGVAHRDLKPENVLVKDVEGSEPILKLCDFGAARFVDSDGRGQGPADGLTNYVGSRWYRAPESMANRIDYGVEVDVWGVACMMAEFATGTNLFDGEVEDEVLGSIISLVGPPPRAEERAFIKHDMPPPDPSTLPRRTFKPYEAGLGSAGVALLREMLTWDKHSRPTMKVCLEHRYLASGGGKAAGMPLSPGAESIADGVDDEYDDDEEEVAEDEEADEAGGEGESDESIDERCWEGVDESAAKILRRVVTEDANATSDDFLSLLADSHAAGTLVKWLSVFLGAAPPSPGTSCCQTAALVPRRRLVDALLRVLESQLEELATRCHDWLTEQHRSNLNLDDVAEACAPNKLTPRAATICRTSARLLERMSDGGTEGLPRGALACARLNDIAAAISALLRDEDRPASGRMQGLARLEQSLGIFKLQEYPALLGPVAKSDLLHLHLSLSCPSPPKRLTLTTARPEALERCIALLEKSDLLDREERESAVASVIVCPYYTSPFGKKTSEGQAVEEGEGLGPRKELFSILALQLQQKWRQAGSAKVSYRRNHPVVTVDPPFVSFNDKARRGAATDALLGHRLVLRAPPLSYSAEDAAEAATAPYREVTAVLDDRSVRVDRPMDADARDTMVEVQAKSQPAFTYNQGGECLWFNAALTRGPSTERLLRFVGLMMGLTVHNACQLDLRLPELFFRAVRAGARWLPTVSDMKELDPSFKSTIDNIRGMSERQFQDLLGVEDFVCKNPRASLPDRKDEYVAFMVEEFFAPARDWMIPALSEGLLRAVPKQLMVDLGMTPYDLSIIICGADDDPNRDFDIRIVFKVNMDSDLEACEPLKEVFWEVVDSLAPAKKRKLLLFITGVGRLPAKGTEFISIENPNMQYSAEDAKKNLAMIPQSHTCDNILELPNYWDALVATSPKGTPTGTLRARLRSVLEEKLAIAIANSAGYGLDALNDEGQGVSDGGGALWRQQNTEDADGGFDEMSEASLSIPGLDDNLEEMAAESRGGDEVAPVEAGAQGLEDEEDEEEEYSDDDYDDDDDDFEFEEDSGVLE